MATDEQHIRDRVVAFVTATRPNMDEQDARDMAYSLYYKFQSEMHFTKFADKAQWLLAGLDELEDACLAVGCVVGYARKGTVEEMRTEVRRTFREDQDREPGDEPTYKDSEFATSLTWLALDDLDLWLLINELRVKATAAFQDSLLDVLRNDGPNMERIIEELWFDVVKGWYERQQKAAVPA